MEGNRPGSPLFPSTSPRFQSALKSSLDAAAEDVSGSAARWAALSESARIELLDRLLSDCARLAPEWVETSASGKGVLDNPDAVGQEWVSGPYVTLRYLRRLRDSLQQIQREGTLRVLRVNGREADGRAVVRALPQSIYDRLFFAGVSAEVVMGPGIAPGDIQSHVAREYLGDSPTLGTTLVLGAGNVSGMGPIDSLFRLFLRNHTVVLKMNPVNGYMSEVIERGLRALTEQGFLRVVQGGPEEGAYLCDHHCVDEIHVTGSDKTYDAVVYGSDNVAPDRKARGEPLRSKPVTAELGGVGPAIVVPGSWTQREILQGAELVATIAFDGGGFSCGAVDLIVLHHAWPQRETFLEALRSVLSRMPLRPAYYPGARERYSAFVDSHAEVEFFGQPAEGQLPWALIRGLDPGDKEEMCFSREPFCAVVAEAVLRADNVDSYLERAVRFANERVWGTLGVTLLVPASVARNRSAAARVERSVADLEYGTIGVNYHPSAAWVAGTTPWGGFQSTDVDPSESGIGFTQNAMMLADTEKTIIRAALAGPLPPPVWLVGHGRAMCETFSRLCRFEGHPSLAQIPGILKAGLGR